MLRLESIKKDYKVADTFVQALKGINLAFRKNEFVSILGPSGCGKTTMLNIIGGLDKYTSGDLFINGKSTKEFKDNDWDVYRNHRIGFIFQSYNLIPHQTILGNVELALTIAGLSKDERIAKAKAAIDRVGLKDQYYKHPNQLSGGQCQRVAIARALVNEPEILLADEPTGALDTQTSIQIMDLIKEIAQERLVIMVTHNPDLAEKYSTRIVRLLDGQVLSDSNPYTLDEERAEYKEQVEVVETKKEKAKMSFWTAFKLSLRNLFTKKARTILTVIAGSIGIIGVSAVLAVSSGVRGYITSMQDDMLSGNPVEINEKGYDLAAMMSGMGPTQRLDSLEVKDGYINVRSMIASIIKQGENITQMQINNNITKEYIDYIKQIDSKYAAAITFDYGLDLTNNIYTGFTVNNGDEAENISLSAIRTIYTSVLKDAGFAQYAGYVTGLTEVFQQAPNDKDYVLSQYDLIYGDGLAEAEDEIMIVINDDYELTDLLLAQLGYYTQEEFINTVYRYINDPNYKASIDKNRFEYAELVGKEFTWYPNDTVYSLGSSQTTPFNYNYKSDNFDGGLKLKVKGILKPKDTISYGCMTSGFFYTEALTKKAIASGLESTIVKALIASKRTSITSGIFTEAGIPTGITYKYSYQSPDGTINNDVLGFVGTTNSMVDIIGQFLTGESDSTQSIYTLTLRELGGIDLANSIKIYPVNFDLKKGVIDYLDKWNSDETIVYTLEDGTTVTLIADDRSNIKYTDNIEVIINLINSLISLVTTALISFTALSLVVSCFMIAIITYVSVVERVKEIGVIRSLGGRKKDVSHLFNAETFIIGLASGVFGVVVTYILSAILNVVVANAAGVYPIAALPPIQALIMIIVSILLTVISGLIPARSAAKKDPVVALRTE